MKYVPIAYLLTYVDYLNDVDYVIKALIEHVLTSL